MSQLELTPGDRFAWNPRVAARTLDGTAFILLDGRMVSLNAVGTEIWDLCKQPRGVDEVVAAVVEAFETTEDVARQDALPFLHDMLGRGFLVRQGEAPAAAPATRSP